MLKFRCCVGGLYSIIQNKNIWLNKKVDVYFFFFTNSYVRTTLLLTLENQSPIATYTGSIVPS